MTLRYNLTGADRKRLVTAISEITGAPAKYLGAPSFAYRCPIIFHHPCHRLKGKQNHITVN